MFSRWATEVKDSPPDVVVAQAQGRSALPGTAPAEPTPTMKVWGGSIGFRRSSPASRRPASAMLGPVGQARMGEACEQALAEPARFALDRCHRIAICSALTFAPASGGASRRAEVAQQLKESPWKADSAGVIDVLATTSLNEKGSQERRACRPVGASRLKP